METLEIQVIIKEVYSMLKKSISFLIVLTCVLSLLPIALAHRESPEILAEITGKSVKEITKLLEKGKTPYQICADANKIDEFKEYKLKNIREKLDKAVKEGGMTKNMADEYYRKAEISIKNWDGSKPPKVKTKDSDEKQKTCENCFCQ